jgi:hypothetical protein
MEVRGEERGAAQRGHEVLADGPGQAEAVVCARAAPQLVDDDQRARARALRRSELLNLSQEYIYEHFSRMYFDIKYNNATILGDFLYQSYLLT